MLLEELNKLYMVHSLKKNAAYPYPVLKPTIAIKYISDCIECGHKFEGIDGFHTLQNNKIQPDQSLSVDVWDYRDKNIAEFYGDVGRILFEALTENNLVFEIVVTENNNSRLP